MAPANLVTCDMHCSLAELWDALFLDPSFCEKVLDDAKDEVGAIWGIYGVTLRV